MQELLTAVCEYYGDLVDDRKAEDSDHLLTVGSVNDMFKEKSQDSMEWKEQTSQVDFEKF